MSDQPFSGRFTSLLLEGLAHYRKGEMQDAMRAWESAYHTEAGNPQAREFLRTALVRLHGELDKDKARAHSWLEPPAETKAPAPPPLRLSADVSPWDQGPSRALPDQKPVPLARTSPSPPQPPKEAERRTPATVKRVPAQQRDAMKSTDQFARPAVPLARVPTPHETRKIGSAPTPPALRPLPEALPMPRRPPPPPPDALQPPPPPPDALLPSGEAELNAAESAAHQEEMRHSSGQAGLLLREARERVERRDYGGALELTAQVLAHQPGHPEAHLLEAECEAGLSEAYEASLGKLAQRPRVKMTQLQLLKLNLDASAGFVLSQIDGGVSYEDLFDVCGLPRPEVARILARLLRDGVIGL